jgi:predicted GIY-YIG superfamily endonuclease
LKKSGVYMLSCGDCDKVYLGETGRQFFQRFREHKRGEGEVTTNSLYARHFLEEGHKFIDPFESYKIIKIVNKDRERKLKEEVEILKIRNKNEGRLMNIKTKFDNEEIFRNLM